MLLLGLGATLYIVPYLLGVQMTELHGQRVEKLVPVLVSNQNTDLALPLCYLSGWLVGMHGPDRRRLQPALDRSATGRPRHGGRPMNPPLNADDLANALVNGASGWLVLSVAAVLPMIWTFTLVMHFARPAVDPVPAVADAAVRRRRLVAVLRPVSATRCSSSRWA